MSAAKPLSEIDKRFVEEYLVDLNAARAYSAARPNVKKNTAKSNGYKLLQQPHVQVAIAAAMAERTKRLEISADDVIRELWDNAKGAKLNRDFSASNMALKLVGQQLHGMFREKSPLNLHVDLDKLTDAQLAHIAAGGDVGTMPPA